jgi:hypothetical protein
MAVEYEFGTVSGPREITNVCVNYLLSYGFFLVFFASDEINVIVLVYLYRVNFFFGILAFMSRHAARQSGGGEVK